MVFNPAKLSQTAIEIAESSDELYVSIVSIWEIMIKEQIGKLDIAETSAMDLKKICEEMDIRIIQTSVSQIDRIRYLPVYKDHGDPFDRLIISTAMELDIPVITSDRKFERYDNKVVW